MDSTASFSCGGAGLKLSRIEVRCPRCSSPIRDLEWRPFCANAVCEYAEAGFPLSAGQPVLIDFANSIFDRDLYLGNTGSVLKRDVKRRSVGSRLHQFGFGKNPIAASNCTKFIDLLKQEAERPAILVIGGGTIGSGADELYDDGSIELSVPMSMHRRIPRWWPTPTNYRLMTGFLTGSGSRQCSSTCWSLQRSSAKSIGCFGRGAGLCGNAVHAAGARARL